MKASCPGLKKTGKKKRKERNDALLRKKIMTEVKVSEILLSFSKIIQIFILFSFFVFQILRCHKKKIFEKKNNHNRKIPVSTRVTHTPPHNTFPQNAEQLRVSVASLQPADKEGFCTKQGGSIKTWKKRWFVLKGNKLWYFKNKTDTEAKGFIELEAGTIVRDESTHRKKKNMFSIQARGFKFGVFLFFSFFFEIFFK